MTENSSYYSPSVAASAHKPLPERTLGISAGDVIDIVEREIVHTLKQARGNQLQAVKIGLERLHASGLITPVILNV